MYNSRPVLARWLPENVSTVGGEIDRVIAVIGYVVGAWLVGAELALFWFILRYRRRPGSRARYVTGETLRAACWVLVPAALVLFCDLVVDYVGAHVWETVKQTAPPAELVVRARGEQFAWRFTQPGRDGRLDTDDDIETLNHLYVPANRVVHVELASRDVIHSLWLPHLRLKQDAVPGRRFTVWFEVTKPGDYPVACAELCGFGHTKMVGVLHAMTEDAYGEWVDLQQIEERDEFWEE